MKAVLTIAGSDCSGGAGIQADLKTMTIHQVYGMSAITALTAQNTLGVSAIQMVSPEFLLEQLERIFEDIPPDAVKIGMIGSAELTQVIVHTLKKYKPPFVVVDPVMVATSGANLSTLNANKTLLLDLLPLATLITPNLYELEQLTQASPILTKSQMVEAAKILSHTTGTAILAKGGHLTEEASDLLYLKDDTLHWFEGKRYLTTNTHGTGCTLSSAIACYLALGHTLSESVKRSKDYVAGAIADGMNLGKGNGPLNHCYTTAFYG
ncbi:MAG: bifunctional hydroxymethylpyrimidine kinase/phosphomethylpyrimidine kinase [Cellulosilyticaceae bacterium]